VLSALLREEIENPGALPELRQVAREALKGDDALVLKTLRRLRGKALLRVYTGDFAFGELSYAGRKEAERCSSETGDRATRQRPHRS